MPVRPELRHFYVGAAWIATRGRVLRRAKNRCQQCGKPNNRAIVTITGGVSGRGGRTSPMIWARSIDGPWFDTNGKHFSVRGLSQRARVIRVVLTIAHLNHTPGDDRDENLKALCQWCHLNYDKLHHHETRAARKDAARPLLNEGAQ